MRVGHFGTEVPNVAALIPAALACCLGARFVGTGGGRASPLVKQNTVSTNVSRVPCLSHLATKPIGI
jgi:hypothetical protein